MILGPGIAGSNLIIKLHQLLLLNYRIVLWAELVEEAPMARQYRQGDVLLKQVDQIPSDASPMDPDEGRVVLAYGEVTGHAHAIESMLATMFKKGDKEYLKALPGALLRHEEHAPIEIEPGTYEIVHQREYVPQSWRLVAD